MNLWQRLSDWWGGFPAWKRELAAEIGKRFDMNGREYIRQTGDECWREMFRDGLSPSDAVDEEFTAAVASQ